MVLDCARYNLLPLPTFYSQDLRDNYCQDASHTLVIPAGMFTPANNYSGFTASRCMPAESMLVRNGEQAQAFSPSKLQPLARLFSGDVSAFSLNATATGNNENLGSICLHRAYFVAQDRSVTDLQRVRELKDFFAGSACREQIGESECNALASGLREMLRSSISFRELYPEETPFLDTTLGLGMKVLAGGSLGALVFIAWQRITDRLFPPSGPQGGSGSSTFSSSSAPAPTAPALDDQRIAIPETSSSSSTQNWIDGGLFAGAAATAGTIMIRTVLPMLARGAAILILSLI